MVFDCINLVTLILKLMWLNILEKKWNQHINEKGDHRFNEANVGFEEEVRNLKLQLEEKNEEIISLRQREIQNEDYSSRLARKLDRLMVENQNKAQKDLRKLSIRADFGAPVRWSLIPLKIQFLGDRMSLLEEKNRLNVENSNLKRQLDELSSRIKIDFHSNSNFIPPMLNGEQVIDQSDIRSINSQWERSLDRKSMRSLSDQSACGRGTLNQYLESDEEIDVRVHRMTISRVKINFVVS